ncbi:MAG: exodeoxyribonuclease VII small subunit [Alphaproteobacteria bacterium]
MSPNQNKILSEIKALSFEDSLTALEDIVRQLEGGRIKLEDAVDAYEKGILLKNHCEEKLKDASLRIEKISVSEDGEAITLEPFETKPAD